MSGLWVTADLAQAGMGEHTELYLLEDGRGMMIGSASATPIGPGPRGDRSVPRIVMGFPVRASMDGEVLRVVAQWQQGGASVKEIAFDCPYRPDDATVYCVLPDRVERVMRRRSETVAPEVVRMLDGMAAGQPSAPRPAPSTPP